MEVREARVVNSSYWVSVVSLGASRSITGQCSDGTGAFAGTTSGTNGIERGSGTAATAQTRSKGCYLARNERRKFAIAVPSREENVFGSELIGDPVPINLDRGQHIPAAAVISLEPFHVPVARDAKVTGTVQVAPAKTRRCRCFR